MQASIEQAVIAHRAGNLAEAEVIYRLILKDQPQHSDANHNLGVLSVSVNKLRDALPLLRTALNGNPRQGEYWISYIDALIKDLQFDVAHNVLKQGIKLGLSGDRVDAFTKILVLHKKTHNNSEPSQSELNFLLAQYQSGQFSAAEALAIKITQKYPNHQFGWKVLGVVLQQMGKPHDSEIANQKAIILIPSDAEAHNNLGNTLRVLGRLADAEASYQRAVELKPDFAAAFNNLGVTRKELGRFDEAEVCYRQAIRLKPDYADAHNNLGVILQELGRLEEAEKSSREAVKCMPKFAEAHYNLGVILNELSRPIEGLSSVVTSQKIKPIISNKNLLVAILKNIIPKTWDQSLSDMVIAGLLEPWGRPSDLMGIACRLLKLEAGFIRILEKKDINFFNSFEKTHLESSALLRAMLLSSPIPDYQLESFFITLRKHFLQKALSTKALEFENNALPAIYCYLAQQCFINEYVYFQTEDELDDVRQLLELLAKAINQEKRLPESLVIAVACYIPLHLIPGVEKLLELDWSTEVKNVLIQQIQEPLEELKIRDSIPRLTSIENLISLDVKRMYEENPYPRWLRYPKEVNSITLNARLRELFPFSRVIVSHVSVSPARCEASRRELTSFKYCELKEVARRLLAATLRIIHQHV
jgi:Flp pilus assembly protein TadD